MSRKSLLSVSDSFDIMPSNLYNRFELTLKNYELFAPYKNALYNYLQAVKRPINCIPNCLQYPLLFFYTKKRNKFLFFIDGFRFANSFSYRITPRTFPSFLRFLGFPEGPLHLRNCLLEELDAFVRKYPYKERDLFTKKAFANAPEYTEILENRLVISPQKNLYLPKLVNRNTKDRALFPYSTVLSGNFEKPQKFSNAFMKQYLGALVKDPRNNAISYPLFPLPNDCLVFFNGTENSTENYRLLVPQSAPRFNPIQQPIFPTKILLFNNLPQKVPAGAASWLFQLTGGSTVLLEQLASLLASAASPTSSKKISVLCSTQNADILLDFLCVVLEPLISVSQRNRIHELRSINNYCRASGLRELFVGQETGSGVVFVNDNAISDTARLTLKKLLSGRPVSISVTGFPRQFLHNRNHFICISSVPEKAERLSKDLKATLLDFSKNEIPARIPIKDLSDEDIQWLRCVFLPYGLLDIQPKTTATKIQTTAWVEEFLKDCCLPQKGILRNRHDFYAEYCACYTAKFPGKKPPLTKGRFVKEVRYLLDKGICRGARYQKIRKEQKMYFVGICCVKKPCEIHPDSQEMLLEQFKTRINIINRVRPVWHSDHDTPTALLPASTE